MASTFFGLTIGTSGLFTYQAALNTTGHNISNVNTRGYTRQQVLQQAGDPMRTYMSNGMQGTGVVTTGIEQIRNEYYDVKYRNNNANYGQSIKQYDYLLQIENYFKGNIANSSDSTDATTKTEDDFVTIFDNMFDALEELQKSSDDPSKRNAFANSMQSLAEYFNSASTSLKKMQSDCNQEIKNKVSAINAIVEEVATLNRQINVIELGGNMANDLRDQRNLLMDELSAIVPIEVIEEPIYNNDDPDSPSGAHTYTVKIAGQTVVLGDDFKMLDLVPRTTETKKNQNDVDGLYDIVWSNGDSFNPLSGQMGGELKALFQIRDGNNGENLQGRVGAIDVRDNSITISGANITDVNKMNMPPKGTLTVGNTVMKYTSFEYDSDTGEYKFFIDDSENRVNQSMVDNNLEVSIGKTVDFMGIPYYMSQMNEFVRKFSSTFNEIHAGNEAYNNTITGNIFTGKNKVDGTEYGFEDGRINSSSDTYYQLTAENFSVLASILKTPDNLATTGEIKDGVAQYDVLDRLKAVKTAKGFFRGTSSSEFLQCILTDLAIDTKRSSTLTTNYGNIGKAIETQRMSISSVDNDEEALNLIKYQNAYNLSAKVISVMSEVYDRLITGTGV